jgi:hypothetical protein
VSLPIKQKIVSSIYTGKLVIDEKECRTPGLNEVVEQICQLGAVSRGIKKGQACDSASLSNSVTPQVRFSNFFMEDLKRLAALEINL